MPDNIEFKACVRSIEALKATIAALTTEGPVEIAQDDTFVSCASGRLKLRMFSGSEGELIFYWRANQRGPKESFYVRAPTASPETLREALSVAYGQMGRVVKRRILYFRGEDPRTS
jgi:adenylate cyclase class IV